MIQTERKTAAVHLWYEKLEKLSTMYLLTLSIGKACTDGEEERLNKLLDERQKLMDQVDTLDAGLKTMDIQKGAFYEEENAMHVLAEKIEVADRHVRRTLEEKLAELRDGMRGTSKLRKGMRAYIYTVRQADGMYFDTKK